MDLYWVGRASSHQLAGLDTRATGPIGRWHRLLPGGSDLTEHHRPGRGAGQDPGSFHKQLSNWYVGCVRHDGDGAELDPLAPETRPRAGAGVQARMRRSTANAGSCQRTSASATVIFGAMRHAVGRLRDRPGGAGLDRVQHGDQKARSGAGQPVQQIAGGVRGPIFSTKVPNTGPVSMPASSWNTDAPVTSSPCSTACWTGAAPRHAGSSEKCRLIQPRRGSSSAAGGTSAP